MISPDQADWSLEAPRERRGLVISDLHLFSERSEGEACFHRVESEIQTTDDLVLNGDTFDFRWSRHFSEAASIKHALKWLESLITQHGSLQVHFLLGNHDCLDAFHREVSIWAETQPRFSLRPDRLILGRNLFLHGDCTNRRMDGAALARFRAAWGRDRPRGRTASQVYELLDSIGVSRRFHDWYFPNERTLNRLAYHLDKVMPDWQERIDHCFFGHTHRPFQACPHRGTHFSNTGSGIRGMGFLPLPFSWTRIHEDQIQSITSHD